MHACMNRGFTHPFQAALSFTLPPFFFIFSWQALAAIASNPTPPERLFGFPESQN